MAELEVRRDGDRYLSRSPGIETRHSFSFGPHYDAANSGFGPLVLHDEHRLEPGAGFPPHRHRGVEVVSWVLEGVLLHEDAEGRVRELRPGSLQHLSTGSGTVHAERAGGVPTRFVQAWLLADGPESTPAYDSSVPEPDGLAEVLRVGRSALWVGRLPAGTRGRIPGAPLLHLFVAGGRVELAGSELRAGDAARRTGLDGLELRVHEEAELLLWEMQVTDPLSRQGQQPTGADPRGRAGASSVA